MVFTILEDFFSEEMRSQYVKGLTYNSAEKEGGPGCPIELVETWVAAGRARWGGEAQSGVSGRG